MIRQTDLPTSHACTALGMSRSSYYFKPAELPAGVDLSLRKMIRDIALEFAGYGYRRITIALRRQNVIINHKKVLRLMHAENVLCKRKSFKPQTTNSNHNQPLYPNLVRNISVTKLNQVWVTDITYVAIANCWVYLTTILDLFSRKCIGWALSRRIDTELCLEALEMAIAQRKIFGFEGLIHHSDRGVQYASNAYTKRLNEEEILISMTETGNPRENAYAESFFKTLKVEEVYLKEYNTFEEAYKNIKQFIEAVYNAKRLHSSIGYQTPNEMEAEVLNIR